MLLNKVAPDFTLETVYCTKNDEPEIEKKRNTVIKNVGLKDFQGRWLLLLFYPLDFTFVCPTEICAFSDCKKEFDDLSCAVLAISVDSVYTHTAWINTPRENGGVADIQIPLGADLTKNVSRDYFALLPDGHSCRATILIDPNQIVRHICYNDPPVGRNVRECLRLIKGYRFFEENGEVCPHGWEPGDKTIKPDPYEKDDYFVDID